MTLRHLVPALGLAALTATSAFSADAVPAITWAGWSDNILSLTSTDDNRTGPSNDPLTAKDDSGAALRFSAAASLKAKMQFGDMVTANVNLWFYPGGASQFDDTATAANEQSSNSNLNAREMFAAVKLGNGFSWQMGKYIDHVGWLSAEPTGLYSVNASLIGYTSIYGNDVIGTALIWEDAMRAPVRAELHITNGYSTSSDAISPGYTAAPSASRENSDLGIGFDFAFMLPDNMGKIDFDFYYDMHSDANAPANGFGGDVLLVGLNATIVPTKELTLGAEVMMHTLGDAENANGTKVTNSSRDRIQGLLLANYAFPGAPANLSVTGMVQYVQIEPDTLAAGEDKETRLGISGVLMSTPFNSKNVGLNFEIGYFSIENGGDPSTAGTQFDSVATATYGPKKDGFVVSLELIAFILP